MPINPIVLQRRHAELGRIRLGNKGDRGQPQKLETFRFTSPSQRYIEDLASIYGGDPRPWDNSGKAEFEVYTTVKTLPVVAVKGGLSQWMETWTGGGCIHRCDGVHNVLTDEPCEPKDPAHKSAKPTTRLSLMLPELEAIGVWRMETHGWNAAAEIPAVAELAQYVGDLVPAELHLVERRAVKDGKTSRFVVPVLDLKIGTQRLREIVQSVAGGGELQAPAHSGAPALEAPKTQQAPPAGVPIPTPEQIAASDVYTLRQMHDYLGKNGLNEHPAMAAIKKRIDHLEDHEDDIVDGEVVEDPPASAEPGSEPDPDAVWAEILKAASDRHGWTLDQVLEHFKTDMGMIPDEATGNELAAFLSMITTGEEPAA